MQKPTIIYGLLMAAVAFVLNWLERQYSVNLFSTELYLVLLAALFTGVGIWIGMRLRPETPVPPFEMNTRVIQTLGLTKKELQVLNLLSTGSSNKEIASQLFVSTSTIKTHLVHLYQKLNVSRRTQAIEKARRLKILP
jgi:DNA-binding CsgD family transcriptional regulator